ncbi:MAG: hypothetical protein IKL59_05830 [Clostridia bacterium]|nr:hypothetical protein [Clostridia bacterium]
MSNTEQIGSKKKIFTDMIWSVSGLVLMNVTLQFMIYPFWEKKLGEDGLGNILYLLALMNIFAVSIGISVNYARITASNKGETKNTVYMLVLTGASVISFGVAMLIGFFGGVEMTLLEKLLFGFVMCATMWRYYADVEYKLFLNYKSYFLYYLFISIGYGIGIGLFYLTGLWPLTLLVGECFGLSFVLLRGRIFKPDGKTDSAEMRAVIKISVLLFAAEAISTLIFNADRIALKAVIDETAVTNYYLASLLGKTVALITTPLNGVIVGYLAKYKGELRFKLMTVITVAALAVIALATVACTVGSYIIIPILYPDQFETVKQYFVVTNLAQIFYFAANVTTVVLLRFAKSRYQIYVNVAYALAFCAICIPLAAMYGFSAFCTGLLITCFIRFFTSIALGYFSVISTKIKNKKQNTN